MHFPAARQQAQPGTWKIKLRSSSLLSCLLLQTLGSLNSADNPVDDV